MDQTGHTPVYFPSCNFTAASPAAAKKLRGYLSGKMPVAGCCRTDKRPLTQADTAIYFCQACRETLEARQENRPAVENLFVYMERQGDFPWPDYAGLTVHVQDCWRDRQHPEVFRAVRAALAKMHVQVVELAENRERSTFCGSLHFEPQKPENQALLAQYPGTPLYQLPQEAQAALMREQVEKYTCPLAVTYCNRCTAGIAAGGGRAVHLVELMMGTYSPGVAL